MELVGRQKLTVKIMIANGTETSPGAANLENDTSLTVACEHFIPMRKADLLTKLAADGAFSGHERAQFLELCRRLEAAFHYEYHERLEELKNAYAPFDPDADTLAIRQLSDGERNALTPPLFEKFVELLERANFRRLSRTELEEAVDAASDWGLNLHVDFSIFQELEVFARGDVASRRDRRRWHKLYRLESVDVPVYQRLVIIFRLHPHKRMESQNNTRTVYIKIFKNIPKLDLDMLLPGSRVKMSLLDQGKIWFPTLTGVSLALYKIVQGALLVAYASVYGLVALLGLVGGTVGYGIKSFFGYLRTKDKHQLNLTRSLYYQNLDNNAGVLFRLIDEAEEQEFREAVLAYYLLRQEAGEAGWTEEHLDRQAEAWLLKATSMHVDFEVDDALAKLARLGLVESLPGNRLRAVSLDSALAHLSSAWINKLFTPRETPESAIPKPHISAALVRKCDGVHDEGNCPSTKLE